MDQEEFIRRLVQLRMNKGVSARDMSLSIGQSQSYINNIENGVNYPSMGTFFYLCQYLGVTPKEFFDVESCQSREGKGASGSGPGPQRCAYGAFDCAGKGLKETVEQMKEIQDGERN